MIYSLKHLGLTLTLLLHFGLLNALLIQILDELLPLHPVDKWTDVSAVSEERSARQVKRTSCWRQETGDEVTPGGTCESGRLLLFVDTVNTISFAQQVICRDTECTTFLSHHKKGLVICDIALTHQTPKRSRASCFYSLSRLQFTHFRNSTAASRFHQLTNRLFLS